MSILYILTNEAMPDIIKIGTTTDLNQRLKSLYTTGVPLPFECFYAVEIEHASKIEKNIHMAFDKYRINQNREYFNITPENAKAILETYTLLSGTDVTPKELVIENNNDLEGLEKIKIRKRFNFEMVDISPGDILTFRKDKSITCEVVNETQIRYKDQIMSLSSSALEILRGMDYDWSTVQGTAFWCYKGKTLNELRSSLE